jgi:hypothetical protein
MHSCLNFMGPCNVIIILIFVYPTRYIFTQHILAGNCSTCFGRQLHPSSRAQTTVSTASGICHTVTVICLCRGELEPVWVCCGWRTPPTAHSNRMYLPRNFLILPARWCSGNAVVRKVSSLILGRFSDCYIELVVVTRSHYRTMT